MSRKLFHVYTEKCDSLKESKTNKLIYYIKSFDKLKWVSVKSSIFVVFLLLNNLHTVNDKILSEIEFFFVDIMKHGRDMGW